MKEFSIALFLVSGALKAQLLILLPWFPDVTLVAVAMVILSLLSTSYSLSDRIGISALLYFSLFSLFLLSVVASALYSPSGLIILKLTKLAVVLLAFLIALTASDINWKRFALSYLILVSVTAVLFIFIFPRYRLGLLGVDSEFYGGSYLGFGNACAIALILHYTFFGDRSIIASVTVTVFFVFCMVLAGARAPILFLGALSVIWLFYVLVIWVAKSRSVSRSFLLALMTITPIVMSSMFFISEQQFFHDTNLFTTLGHSVDRLLLLFGDAKGDSFNVRINHLSESTKAIDTAVFTGVGLASYGLSVMGNDLWEYPHNIFLEVWVESGLFAVLALAVLVTVALVKLLFVSRQFWLALIVMYCLLNAMKSVSFADNRILFFWIGVAIVYSGHRHSAHRAVEQAAS